MSRNIIASHHERIVAAQDGNVILVDREVAHRTGLLHFCVHLLCTMRESVYLQRRAASRRRNANAWTSTVSGHVTAEDAAGTSFAAPAIVLEIAATRALRHEFCEELGAAVPEVWQLNTLGDVPSLSQGNGETCNCRARVFAAAVHSVSWRPTREVQELRAFDISHVRQALESGSGLPGNDGELHPFADNFAPVFRLFVAKISGTTEGA